MPVTGLAAGHFNHLAKVKHAKATQTLDVYQTTATTATITLLTPTTQELVVVETVQLWNLKVRTKPKMNARMYVHTDVNYAIFLEHLVRLV